MADAKLFLSCVSDEFGDYRDELRRALTRPNVEIKIQEEFQAMGGDTLALLETYVESCDVVIHFVGDMAGSTPKPSSVDDLLRRRPELAARLAEKDCRRPATPLRDSAAFNSLWAVHGRRIVYGHAVSRGSLVREIRVGANLREPE
jgi:hypothetical protein